MATIRTRRFVIAMLLSLAPVGCVTTSVSEPTVPGRDAGFESAPIRLPPVDTSDSLSDVSQGSEIMLASYEEEPPEPAAEFPLGRETASPLPLAYDAETLPEVPEDRFAIDLPTALELAGANNLQIAFARQRVNEAMSRVRAADVLWVPNLRAGVVYNNHYGRIQTTPGEVIEAARSSLFAGAGAIADRAPTAGGSGGPARMFVDLPLVEVLLEPLATRQAASARQANHAVAFNDTLLAAGQSYLALQQAESQLAITSEAVKNATILAALTAEFAAAGRGLQADAERAEVELANRRRQLSEAGEGVGVASAELARLLRLDQSTVLYPAEQYPVSLDLVPSGMPLPVLIQQALSSRPELDRETCLVAEAWTRQRKESLRPWMPNLFAGYSGGGFGGSSGSSIDRFSDRGDVDVGAIWEWKNLGIGNRARQRERSSLYGQARISREQTRDIIASEVARSYRQVEARRDQLESARRQIQAATRALELNLEGIRGAVVRPIEAQQAIAALADARRDHLSAVIGYNAAQLSLIRAVGQPPSMDPVVLP